VIHWSVPNQVGFKGESVNDPLFHQHAVKHQFAKKWQALSNLAHGGHRNRPFVFAANDCPWHDIAKGCAFQRPIDPSTKQCINGDAQAKLD